MVKTGKKVSLKFIWPLLFPMGSYLLLSLFFDVVIISIFTFIHFSLSHPLPQIEEWLVEHSWEVVILGKAIAFVCSYIAVSSRPNWPKLWWKLFIIREWPSLEVVAGSLASIIAIGLASGVDYSHRFYPFRLSANLGMLLFFLFDFIWMRILLKTSVQKLPNGKQSFLLLSLILAFLNYLKHPYLQFIDSMIFAHFLFALNFKKDSDVLAYLFCFIIPLHSLYLGDFAFGPESAFFSLSKYHFVGLGIALLLGIYWKHSKIWPGHIDDFPSNSDNSI